MKFENLDGEFFGLKIHISATKMGHYCGYVQVPEGHPLHGKDYGDKCLPRLDSDTEVGKRGVLSLLFDSGEGEMSPDCYFDVHGGITFAGEMKTHKGWWFGFDCAHCDDAKHPDYITDIDLKYPTGGVFRDQDYVKSECESLAIQISELAI